MQGIEVIKTRTKKNKTSYYNAPLSFDIETTSFIREDGEKTALMYIWQFNINGYTILGRSWEHFIILLETLQTTLQLGEDKRVIVYDHNLAYEFQFIRKRIKWASVFSLSEREPVKAISEYGIEFRCSYILSGYSLSTIGKNLLKYKVKKKEGDLDYLKIRNAKTPLTEEEEQYCINDVLVVSAYIQEKIEQDGDITKIPLTKTGYVRNYCRANCLPREEERKKDFKKYSRLMQGLTLDIATYQELKRAYAGGFTHASPLASGEVFDNVGSFDFTSSYPAVCLSRYFPMGEFSLVEIKNSKDFNYYIKEYCCLFDIEFDSLESQFFYDSYISLSKCEAIEDYELNNGRVVRAKRLITTITELDFNIIKKVYTFKSFRVNNFRVAWRGYLPRPIIESILTLYEKKTTLKGVKGKEIEYMSAKENVNSVYGAMVTSVDRMEIVYTESNDWLMQEPDLKEALEIYNNSKSRFLFYAWGVWVTAHARANLWSGIFEMEEDYLYSDTDSLKVLHAENHRKYIEEYNKQVTADISKILTHYKIDPKRASPKTIDGRVKPLGVWDFEGTYQKFKTLGAKRYMVLTDEGYNITVSGLNKKICTPYLEKFAKIENKTPFDIFEDGLYIPPEYTGKNTHTYIDEMREGVVRDYLGNIAEYHELSSVHLSASDYNLSITSDYIDYLLNIKNIKKRG